MIFTDPAKRAAWNRAIQGWQTRVLHRLGLEPTPGVQATVLDLTGQAYLLGRVAASQPGQDHHTLTLEAAAPKLAQEANQLGPQERAAVELARVRAGSFVRKLTSSVEADLTTEAVTQASQALAQAARPALVVPVPVSVASPPAAAAPATLTGDPEAVNQAEREHITRVVVAQVEGRLTHSQAKSALGHGSQDGWKRDWQRVTQTESATVHDQGAADWIATKSGEEDPEVYKVVRPDACENCKRLYLVGGEPIVFLMSELVANGSNFGLKQKEWKPVLGTTHPHCFCRTAHRPKGWIFKDGVAVPPPKLAKSYRDVPAWAGSDAELFEGLQLQPYAQARFNDAMGVADVTPVNEPRLVLTYPHADLGITYPTVDPVRGRITDPQDVLPGALSRGDKIRLMFDPGKLWKAAPGEQAASHKYTTRTWLAGHWVYDYAKQHGGKVEGHLTDLGKVVVKATNHDALVQLAHKHGLSAPWKGPVYSGVEITQAQAHAMQGAAPVASKPVPVAPKKVDPKSKEVQSAPNAGDAKAPTARKGEWKVLTSADMKRPSGLASWQLQRGDQVTVKIDGAIKPGQVLGFDTAGRPQLLIEGKQRTASWGQVKRAQGPQAPYRPAHHALPPGALVAATERQRALFEKALDMQVVGHHRAREFVAWLDAHGHEAYVVGGAARDLIAGTAPGAEQTDAEIFEKLKDIDIVTSAPRPEIKKMLAEVAHDIPGHGIHNDWADGSVVLAGGPKVSKLNAEGLDMASLVSERKGAPSFFPPSGVAPSNPDTGESSWGLTFDHDLAGDTVRRDFAANTLYYDATNHAFVDPTGHGIADAQSRFLRLSGTTTENKRNRTLPMRFWKFRTRGYTSDAATRAQVRQLAEHAFTSSPSTIAKDVLKQGGKVVKDPKAFLAGFRKVMAEDGCADLYDKWIKPREPDILHAAKAAKGKLA